MDIDNYVFIQLFFIEIEEEVLVLSKKIIASFCMFLVALSIGSCGKNEKIDDTTEKNQEPVVLTWYIRGDQDRLNQMECFLELERRLSVDIEFIAPAANSDDAYKLMLASGNLPDIIMWKHNDYPCGGEVGRLYADQIAIDLTEYIEKYAPNLSQIYQERPEIKNEVMTLDNKLIYFPSINPMQTTEERIRKSNSGLVIRNDWLEKVSMEMPITIQDWYEVLTAFKEKDPNRNGLPDEIPFEGGGIDSFLPAYGILGGICLKGDKVVYGPMELEYKQFLEEMNLWYQEGLIGKSSLVSYDKWTDENVMGNLTGAFKGLDNAWTKYLPGLLERVEDASFAAAPWPENENGKKYTNRVEMETYIMQDLTIITSQCKNPEAAVKVIDYMYGEEGKLLLNYGIEHKTYELVEGKPILTEYAMEKNKEGRLNLYEYAMPYVSFPKYGGFEASLQAYLPAQVEASRIWADCDTALIYPPAIAMPVEDTVLVTAYMSEIDAYMIEMQIKFISGEEPLSNFDIYKNTLVKKGVEEVIAAYQKNYNIYINRD